MVRRAIASSPVGRNRRNQNDSSVAGQQLRNKSDAPDVLVAVLLAESQVLAEIVSDDVAVNYFDLQSMGQKFGGNRPADGGLSGSAKSREPDSETALLRDARRDSSTLSPAWTGIASTIMPAATVSLLRIDDDEAAGGAIALVGIAEDRTLQVNLGLADFVELQTVGLDLLKRIDVDLVIQPADPAAEHLGRVLDEIRVSLRSGV